MDQVLKLYHNGPFGTQCHGGFVEMSRLNDAELTYLACLAMKGAWLL
jgi:hypothetical protein